MLIISAALGFALLLAMARGSRLALTLWRWLIARLGPAVFPSPWRIMRGAFPLALLALVIGAWLGLAAAPGMDTLAPGPIEDVNRLAGWFILAGVVGCVMRGLHLAACRTQEHAASTPQPNKADKKATTRTTGKTATQLKARRGTKSQKPRRTRVNTRKPDRSTAARRKA